MKDVMCCGANSRKDWFVQPTRPTLCLFFNLLLPLSLKWEAKFTSIFSDQFQKPVSEYYQRLAKQPPKRLLFFQDTMNLERRKEGEGKQKKTKESFTVLYLPLESENSFSLE